MKIKTLALGSLLGALLLSGCSDDNRDNPTYPNNPGNGGTTVVAPVAVADSFSGRGNAQITGNLFSNDTLNSATLTAQTSPGHGTVSINADGTFTYTPTTGFLGTDSFTYTLGNSAGTSTATVSITLAGVAIFVNNQATAGGDGSQAHPYTTLSAAVTAATGITGAQLVVFQGDGTSTGYNTPITLTGGQSLTSFSSSAPATLTGPVTFTTNNALSFVKINGTTGTAVNATSASNGTIQGVSMANTTIDGCNLSNATGTFFVSNCTLQNIGRAGIIATSSSGSLVWSATNSIFTNVTVVGVESDISQTAAMNTTVSGCSFAGGLSGDAIFLNGNSTATPLNVTITNNIVQGQGTALRGIEILNEGSTTIAGHIFNNTITGCTDTGINLSTRSSSSTLLRFNSNILTGNLAGLGVAVSNNSNVSLAFTNNTSDEYVLTQGDSSIFNVENFSQFNSSQANIGTLNISGTITSVSAGTDGIP